MRRGCRWPARWQRSSGYRHGSCSCAAGSSAMPMAWGILRPSVLMPADADAWPAERLRIVLLHELAHVKRRDCLTHMLAQISCALYWFNPLAWMAARHLRTERERACDDLVLAAGTRGPDYADQLLEIARVMRSGRFPALFGGASLAMAQRSQLEGRLMAILDPTVPRSGVSRLRTVAATLLFACAVMPLAAVQPWTVGRRSSAATVSAAATADGTTPASRMARRRSSRRRRRRQIRRRRRRPPSAADTAVHADAGAGAAGPFCCRDGVSRDHQKQLSKRCGRASSRRYPSHRHVGARVPSLLTCIRTSRPDVQMTISDHEDDKAQEGRSADDRRADGRVEGHRQGCARNGAAGARSAARPQHLRTARPGAGRCRGRRPRAGRVRSRPDARQARGRAADPRAQGSERDVREQAAFALGQLRDRSAVAALTAALKDVGRRRARAGGVCARAAAGSRVGRRAGGGGARREG